MKYIIQFALAVAFLTVVGMVLATLLVMQEEAKQRFLIESASYAHLPTKGKGK